jgi:hypothetical protein
MRKVTMKDIAREANVSSATVSYIINQVDNQTISEDTRSRVLDIAKKLNYVPNLTARALVKGKTGLLGLLLMRNSNDGFWRKLYWGMLTERLESLCKENGYHLLVSYIDTTNPSLNIVLERELDGVFLVDVNSDVFNDISLHFQMGVPLIVMESYIQDPLFYKVLPDYEDTFVELSRIDTKPSFLVTESFNNKELTDHIISSSQVPADSIYVLDNSNLQGLSSFLESQRGKTGIVTNEFIGTLVANETARLQLEVYVLCTGGCPHILPPTVKPILINPEADTALLAFELMQHLLQTPIPTMVTNSKEDPASHFIFSKFMRP